MTSLADHVLREFPADVARLWIAADPDGVLLDEQVLAGLRDRGFEVLRYEDSMAFRAEYESRYRAPWDRGEAGPARSLILHLRSDNVALLPWDYLRRARRVSLGLANLFPDLSYSIVKQLDSELLPLLFEAQNQYASQPLGETGTKEFVLLHLFRISPHLIARTEDLWRELLRMHYQDLVLPRVLAEHLERVLMEHPVFNGLPVARLFTDKGLALRVVQDAWYRYLERRGVTGTRVSEQTSLASVPAIDVPFDHHDVRVLIDSMFLDGLLHPMTTRGIPTGLPEWTKIGVIQGADAARNLILDGIDHLTRELPDSTATYRIWTRFAQRLAELSARFHRLGAEYLEDVDTPVRALIAETDSRLQHWLGRHYSDLPSLPAANAPVMVHHVPRYLAMRRGGGETRIALVVFDGLALDQWVHVRESCVRRVPQLMFDEGACFAWSPTLTSVSRQAIFSGLRPREFSESIETTSRESALWSRYWENQGLHANEVFYRKSLQRLDDLPELAAQLSNPAVKVVGLVVDTVDEIIHGAVLGKRGVANQLATWCETGFVSDLFEMLLEHDFHVYITADHGNVEATGRGRMNQGVASELRGERVRVYRSEALISESATSNRDAFRMSIAGLPPDFLPLFAAGRGAFVPKGDHVVAHGGISVEELIVPFVNVRLVH